MAKEKKIKLRLTLDVVYEPNGVSVSELKQCLEYMVSHAAGAGLLSGDSAGTVEQYEYRVDTVPLVAIL